MAGSEGPGCRASLRFRGGNYSDGDVKDRLARVFALAPNEEIATSLLGVEKTRIRRRRLPF